MSDQVTTGARPAGSYAGIQVVRSKTGYTLDTFNAMRALLLKEGFPLPLAVELTEASFDYLAELSTQHNKPPIVPNLAKNPAPNE